MPDDLMSKFHLIRSKPDVLKDLRKQVSKGRDIGETEYYDEDVPDAIESETKWDLYNTELLSRSFSDESLLNEYRSIHIPKYYGSWEDKANTHENRMRKRVTFLEAVIERIKLIPEGPVSPTSHSPLDKARVFIIHGHDETSKIQVARLIEKLGLTAVILHEQSNKGRTIIEKLEGHSDVAFAVALLTPDDVGGTDSKSTLRPRARQNVIFELGHFESKLGRDKVCVLHTPGVELPSDLGGVAYIEMDKAGGWQFRLARELKDAGLEVDMNLIA